MLVWNTLAGSTGVLRRGDASSSAGCGGPAERNRKLLHTAWWRSTVEAAEAAEASTTQSTGVITVSCRATASQSRLTSPQTCVQPGQHGSAGCTVSVAHCGPPPGGWWRTAASRQCGGPISSRLPNPLCAKWSPTTAWAAGAAATIACPQKLPGAWRSSRNMSTRGTAATARYTSPIGTQPSSAGMRALCDHEGMSGSVWQCSSGAVTCLSSVTGAHRREWRRRRVEVIGRDGLELPAHGRRRRTGPVLI